MANRNSLWRWTLSSPRRARALVSKSSFAICVDGTPYTLTFDCGLTTYPSFVPALHELPVARRPLLQRLHQSPLRSLQVGHFHCSEDGRSLAYANAHAHNHSGFYGDTRWLRTYIREGDFSRSATESESHCNLRTAKSQLKHFRVEMAASSVVGPATSFPLSPKSDSPASSSSPQPPQPPPPTTSSQKPSSLQETHSVVEQEQLLSPSKSQRAHDFLPPQILQALKQQQQQRKRETTTQPTSPRRLQQSPKKENEVSFQVYSSSFFFLCTSPSHYLCLSWQCGLPAVRPPAKLWSYPRQRSKFTHLTAHPPCVCGAGNRSASH